MPPKPTPPPHAVPLVLALLLVAVNFLVAASAVAATAAASASTSDTTPFDPTPIAPATASVVHDTPAASQPPLLDQRPLTTPTPSFSATSSSSAAVAAAVVSAEGSNHTPAALDDAKEPFPATPTTLPSPTAAATASTQPFDDSAAATEKPQATPSPASSIPRGPAAAIINSTSSVAAVTTTPNGSDHAGVGGFSTPLLSPPLPIRVDPAVTPEPSEAKSDASDGGSNDVLAGVPRVVDIIKAMVESARSSATPDSSTTRDEHAAPMASTTTTPAAMVEVTIGSIAVASTELTDSSAAAASSSRVEVDSPALPTDETTTTDSATPSTSVAVAGSAASSPATNASGDATSAVAAATESTTQDTAAALDAGDVRVQLDSVPEVAAVGQVNGTAVASSDLPLDLQKEEMPIVRESEPVEAGAAVAAATMPTSVFGAPNATGATQAEPPSELATTAAAAAALEIPHATLPPSTAADEGNDAGVLPPLPKSVAPKDKERSNYASFDCGARALAWNQGASSPTSILHASRDQYMLNRCAARQFVVVELCDAILIDTVMLANFEFFSSMFRDFKAYVARRYPPRSEDEWLMIGAFRAENVRDYQ
ncbi:hypothetical protein HK405_012697, partial [Cladochytrium tenue]